MCPNRFRHVIGGELGQTGQPTDAAVLGIRLAEGLRAKQGDSLQLLATGPSTRPNLLDVHVVGRQPAATEIDARRLTMVSLAFAQDLLQMPGRVTEYVIAANDVADADHLATTVRAALGPDYEVVSWMDLMPQIRSMLGMIRSVLRIIVGVLMLLLVSAVGNTMFMTVHERIREIGTMMALGVRRQQVVQLLAVEAMFLGVIGSAIGVLLGTAVLQWLHYRGLLFQPPGADVESVMRPNVELATVVATAGLAMVATAVAALGPSWRASKLSPVECLRAT